MPRGNFLENYVPIKFRLNEFRKEHPDWTIRTTVKLMDGHWHAETLISDENGHLIANGNAYEQAKLAFDLEKAETSSVGRALVFAGWTDSLELSREEQERSEVVQEQRKQPARPPGPVTPETVANRPPLNDVPANPPTLDDYMRLNIPPQSAPKGFWQDYITGLVAICEHDGVAVPWRDLTKGVGFADLTTIQLKHLAADVDKWLNEPEVEA